MDFAGLKRRLQQEGYGPLIGEHGPHLLSIYDFRIEKAADGWSVCATERGEILETYLATPDEAAACAFWFDKIAGTMLHLATFENRQPADELERALTGVGIAVWRNDIPHFNGPNDSRYRVFVAGRDLQKARQLIEDWS